MTRPLALLVCGFGLAGCSLASLPSFDLLTSEPPSAILTVESAPPGAEARASNGGVCRTPCELSEAAGQEFTVTYTLDGYTPKTVSVRSIPAVKSALVDMTEPQLDPNPVFAQLEPAPPPPPPVTKRRQRSQ